MSDVNQAIARFELAMQRLETAVGEYKTRRQAAREAGKLAGLAGMSAAGEDPAAAEVADASNTDASAAEAPSAEAPVEASIGGPAGEALAAAEAELSRLRRENEALRAVGAAADEETARRFETALARVARDEDAAV